jgi:cobalt-zinc-cadmium efflux system protein
MMEKHTANNAFSEHLFEYRCVEKKKLILSLCITSVVMIIEFVGGFLTNSIALISDAGHMLTHCFAIGLSLAAIIIARNPPCHHRTFGLYRAEILAAFINGLFLLLVVVVIVYEAVSRILHPREVLGLQMLVIAIVGLAVNTASACILRGSCDTDLNVRSVFYHLIGDIGSSVGVIIAAVVIHYTRWNVIDPLISLGISAIIVYWALGILKESTRILLEMAPSGLNVDIIKDDLKATYPEIKELYNVHLWTITPNMLVFSAHVKLQNPHESPNDQSTLISRVNGYLFEKYRVLESTIQIAS